MKIIALRNNLAEETRKYLRGWKKNQKNKDERRRDGEERRLENFYGDRALHFYGEY